MTHLHRCYICGQNLEYPGQKMEAVEVEPAADQAAGDKPSFNPRTFEIDHIFPQSRGGGRSPRNLGASCNSCNKYKDMLLSYADLPIETAITPSVSDTVEKVFGGKMRFAVLWRQKGACAQCDTKFHHTQDQRLYLNRKNPDDSFHFLNVDILCGACADDQPQTAGALIRE